jgi:phosphoribosylformylglycinamidine (FGAM) synthase-like amidotransferase family enzyme
MSTAEASYRPIKLLDEMEGKNHIVLRYYNEKKKYADLVIARLNGSEGF